MVRSLKVAALFLFGMVLVGALAWPRVTPQTRYYVDTEMGVYHAKYDCPYGHVYAFKDRGDVCGVLPPCPFCASPEHSDKVADRDSHKGQDDTD